jgi:hypothetical protein
MQREARKPQQDKTIHENEVNDSQLSQDPSIVFNLFPRNGTIEKPSHIKNRPFSRAESSQTAASSGTEALTQLYHQHDHQYQYGECLSP